MGVDAPGRGHVRHWLLAAARGSLTDSVTLQAVDLLLAILRACPLPQFQQMLLERAAFAIEQPYANRSDAPGKTEQKNEAEDEHCSDHAKGLEHPWPELGQSPCYIRRVSHGLPCLRGSA